jgi:hypothetical protein
MNLPRVSGRDAGGSEVVAARGQADGSTVPNRALFERAAAAWSTAWARLGVLSGGVFLIAGRRRPSGRSQLHMTKAELYKEARRLGIPGRSNMDSGQLAEAIRRAHERSWSPNFADRWVAGVALVSRPVRALRALTPAVAGRVISPLRGLPTRSLILSLIMLAAGGLGLTLAYAVAPGEDLDAPVLRASRTLRTETVTGPGGTTTFVVTKTKQGKVKRLPVRVLRTVTGPGGTRTTAVAVAGPAITQTQVRKTTDTQVVTQIQPVTEVVTNVVTQSETVVVTTTVVIEVTTTEPSPGPP